MNNEQPTSSCCDTPGDEDIGICPTCHEHCEFTTADEIDADEPVTVDKVTVPYSGEMDDTVYPEPVDLSAKLKRQFAVTMALMFFVGAAFGYYVAMAEASALVLGAK